MEEVERQELLLPLYVIHAALRKRLKEDAAAQRVANYLNCSAEELKTFARITGHNDIHQLSVDDLCTISRKNSEHTNIEHA